MIAVVGESLIDVINGQGIIGGCPLNVARATSRLGASVAYYGKISQDSYGLDILQTLINDCVFFDPALCNDSLKTLCSEAKLDENGKASYVFNYENTCTSNLKIEELVSAFDIANDIDIVFYGSIALLMEPGCDAIVPAIDSIKTKPIRFLDPNVRPFMVKDAKAFKEMILKYASQSEIVKASEEDIAFLYPGISILEAEKQLLDTCKMHLIITRAQNGSTWYSKSFKLDAKALETNVVDTVGCGDVFSAAVMAYIEKHNLARSLDNIDKDTVAKILDYASRAAALNCNKKGCNPPYENELGL